MEKEMLGSVLQSVLFASDRPVTIARFKQVLGEEGPTEEEIQEQVALLKDKFLTMDYGFELREAQGGYQFITKPQNAEYVRRFLETKPFRLGRSSLEVLSIISYRQPITRAEIDSVRGIDSSHLLRTLIERGLVMMDGKAEVPGRPVQYSTTQRFLEVVGLNAISELPPLTELDQLSGDTEDPIKAMERGLDNFIAAPGAQETRVDDQQELSALDTLITSANKGSKEVYESKAHSEVAEENERAVEALNSHPKPRRKRKEMRFEELTNQSPEPEPAPASEPEPPVMTELFEEPTDKPNDQLVN